MTYTMSELDITGYRDEPVPNTFFEQDEPSDYAVIVFPGRKYPCQAPLLHYATLALLEQKADVLWVNYDRHPGYDSFSSEELLQCCIADAEEACSTLLQYKDYEFLTLIGKSLGTLVMGHLLSEGMFSVNVSTVWLTPMLKHPELPEQMRWTTTPSLYVVGTADDSYNAEIMQRVQEATQGQVITIEGANHSLEIGTDVYKSLDAMKQIIRGVQNLPL